MPLKTRAHLGRMLLVTMIGFIVFTYSASPVMAESSGGGSVVGDNIEAEVSFESPPSSSEVTCQWRPVLDITTGAKPGEVAITIRTSAGITESLYLRVCGGELDTYYWIPNGTSSRIATVAKDKVSRMVPTLLARTAPNPGQMIVNQPTWFWIPRMLWRPISVTANLPTPAGPIVVTTTATPRTVSFTPGDGHSSITCKGPGPRWTRAQGDDAHSPCSYTYRSASHTRSTSVYPARVSIKWKITWKSNLGASGTLPSIHTGIGMNVTVAELQALSR